jgi:hypothetical protein
MDYSWWHRPLVVMCMGVLRDYTGHRSDTRTYGTVVLPVCYKWRWYCGNCCAPFPCVALICRTWHLPCRIALLRHVWFQLVAILSHSTWHNAVVVFTMKRLYTYSIRHHHMCSRSVIAAWCSPVNFLSGSIFVPYDLFGAKLKQRGT